MISDQSLLLSTIVLNDTIEKNKYVRIYIIYTYVATCFCYHFSTSFTEDEYEIVANNYFTFCNLTNPGFCTVS